MAKSRDRTVEVFLNLKETSPQTILTLQEQACTACKITILDVGEFEHARRAEKLNISCFPAIVMNGKSLAGCSKQCPAGDALRQTVAT